MAILLCFCIAKYPHKEELLLDMKTVLEKLCGCTAPSGFENPAAQAAQALLALSQIAE